MTVELSSDTLTITILKRGAELCSVKNAEGLEYIWQAHKDFWPRHAPVLFPVVGKLKNNSFSLGETRYSLPQHGFARDCLFEPVLMSSSSCTLRLKADDHLQTSYPFDFILDLGYELEGNTLSCLYSVENPSEHTLYFSIGAHPGFNWPLVKQEEAEDYCLEFESDTYTLSGLKDGLRSGEKQSLRLQDRRLPLTHALFDKDALVFENNQINSIRYFSRKTGHGVHMHCHNWPYFGIWSKAGKAPFICLEPWYGIADEDHTSGQLSEKQGIIALGPGERFESRYSIHFH